MDDDTTKSLQESIAKLVGIKERLELAAEQSGLDPFRCERCKRLMKHCRCTDSQMNKYFRDNQPQ